jgi:hypothetical protein
MLLRATNDGHLAITQTTHAWVSGQMARAWGNEAFGIFEPREPVCLAAEQHDIGWTQWEPEPSWNPETGLPHSFLELPPEVHLSRIWSVAGKLALLTSRYAALLVSRHGTSLYGRFRGDPDVAGGLAAKFLAEQDAFQAQLILSLSRDPQYEPYVADDVLERNRRLVALWDRISLNLCWGMRETLTIEDVPMANGDGTMTLSPVSGETDTVEFDPWPFALPSVDVTFDARLLTRRYTDQQDLLQGIGESRWTSVRVRLRKA